MDQSEKNSVMKMDIDNLRMLASFLDSSDVGMYVADFYSCEILYVNQKMAYYTKSDLSNMIGKPCWTLVNPQYTERCPFCPYIKLLDEDGNPTPPYSWELYNPNLDIWLKVINQAVKWSDGQIKHKVNYYDITELKKAQEKLVSLAYTDRLLQLKNELNLEKDMLQSINEHMPSLIVFDIISLQKINEAYGRSIGDQLLKAVKDWVYQLNITNSELYRIGGDEFCITTRNINKDVLIGISANLMQRFTMPWIIDCDGNTIKIFCNASIAVILDEYISDSEPLLNLIERTLKTTKERKEITIYDHKMDKEYKDRLRFELSIKRCVRDNMDGFDVYYQPFIEAVSGAWCGVEALCRWRSPELGTVSPLLFIPEAERLELIGLIGLWVLDTAIEKCKSWSLDCCSNFILNVNVSPIQFLDEKLTEKILTILNKYGYPSDKLCLEITESTQFVFTDQSLKTIMDLRANNILVALDDFGTGYTNFYQLKNLPVDILKIERDFVNNIENDIYQQYLFQAISELAHTVNMKLIAEGVENETQMEILANKGADRMQGYFISMPLSPSEFESKLNRFNRSHV